MNLKKLNAIIVLATILYKLYKLLDATMQDFKFFAFPKY